MASAVSRVVDLVSESLDGQLSAATNRDRPIVIGVLPGEGVGPQLTDICLQILAVVSRTFGFAAEVQIGGAIGMAALRSSGSVLPPDVCAFCDDVFERGGAVFAGAGGGRFVYDMRRRYQLYVKLNPIMSFPELSGQSAVRWRDDPDVDVMIIRDNIGGLYQGSASEHRETGGRRIEQLFEYREADVRAVTDAAAAQAAKRRGHLTIVAKDSGLPELSDLWFECGRASARAHGVSARTIDMDYMVYQFAATPDAFDVVAVPNCFGDLLADLGGIMCGSRGNTYGASFTHGGAGVYQTNHGAAYDLADKDLANPAGQIFSLAMMLSQSFGHHDAAAAIVGAVRQVWRRGVRTADLAGPQCRVVSCSQFGDDVIAALRARSGMS